MLPQAADYRAEADALHALLDTLDEADWTTPTLFKRWTPNDILQHLHGSDLVAMASATDPAKFDALVAERKALRERGLTNVEETRVRLGNPTGRDLMQRWRRGVDALCDVLDTLDPDGRLKWSGPDMGVRMFTTARQMETWAHGQAIYDLKDREREATDRLKNIAVIGARTFGWTFRNRGLTPPEPVPHVRLRGPRGDVWEWHDPGSTSRVEGDAVAFCQVVAQTRNVADTDLKVTGESAQRWMALAQCFAGPPNDPPAPGTRYRQKAA